ncbi:hypothetical protein A2U01_0062144, partial [Trifolium medium]|nr:hypothetical protein [Trifolium medium]
VMMKMDFQELAGPEKARKGEEQPVSFWLEREKARRARWASKPSQGEALFPAQL